MSDYGSRWRASDMAYDGAQTEADLKWAAELRRQEDAEDRRREEAEKARRRARGDDD